MSQKSYQPGAAAFCALALTTLLSSMSGSIANIGLPTLAAFFHVSFSYIQWVVLAYLLAVTGSVLAMGWLSDRLGRQRLLAAGVLVFTLAALGCGLATGPGWLIAARLFQGLGGAIMLVNGLALVMQVVPAGRSGRAMGIVGSLSALGTAMGPALGGLLIGAFGWRALFLISVLPGLLLWLLIRYSLPPAGTAAAASDSARSMGRAETPPVPTAGLLLSLMVAAVMMTTLVVGPFYLAAGLHLSPRQSGMLMALGPLTAFAAGFPGGILVDRIGHLAQPPAACCCWHRGARCCRPCRRRWGAAAMSAV